MNNANNTCVLERIAEPGDGGRGALIGLHDEQSTPLDVLPLLRLIADGRRLVAPRSARWSGYGSRGRYSWFSCVAPPWVEPVGFGDSLMQLESLVLDDCDIHSSRAAVIVGFGQGGAMALALAALWPELFSAVIAIKSSWPTVPGWDLPQRNMSGVCALIVGECAGVREQLLARDARTTELKADGVDRELAGACRQWLSHEALSGVGRS